MKRITFLSFLLILFSVNTFAQELPSTIIEGHTDRVNSVALSPDGQTLASGSHDRTIRLWDVNTGSLLRTLTGHTHSVLSVAFSPDSNILASGSGDRKIRLWDVNTGRLIRSVPEPTGPVFSVVFRPDGEMLASGGRGPSIRFWDANTGRQVILHFWDANTGKLIGSLGALGPHGGAVLSVAFSPDSNILASGSGDRKIRLWDVNTGRHIRTLAGGHTDSVLSVAFSPDGEMLASGSLGETLRLWDVSTGRHIRTLTGHTHFVESVAFSPDGLMLASGSRDETLGLWDTRTGKRMYTLEAHEDSVNSVAFSPDGLMLASGSSDGTIRLWELPDTRIRLTPFPVVSPVIGEQLTINVNIVAGENVGGYQVRLAFDPTALRYVASANGDYLPSGAFFVPPVVSADTVTLGATSLAGVGDGDGRLATVTFEVLDVKESFIDLFDVILTDSAGEHLNQLPHIPTKVIKPSLIPTDAIISLTPSSVLSPAIGRLLTFTMDITGGQNVKDFVITLDYDRSALQLTSRSEGNYFDEGVGNGGGTLIKLTFEVLAVKAATIRLSGHLIATDGLRYLPTFESAEVVVPLFGDVNRDGVVNILDLVQVASSFGQPVPEEGNPADVNEDGVVNIVDLVKVAGALGGDAAAPSAWSLSMDGTLTRAHVQKWLSEARRFTLTDATSQRGILYLEQLLAALTPKETALLSNYPNPFNPETWIPYQLTSASTVEITVYDARGRIVRQLDLGHKTAGYHTSRSQAAYWDGRNNFGESVASGVYFYTLTAGDFTATRKMLMMK